jgi:ferrous iron transport protein B
MSTHALAYTQRRAFSIDYGREVEEEIVRLQQAIDRSLSIGEHYDSRWLAIKLLEQDSDLHAKLGKLPGGAEVLKLAAVSTAHLRDVYNDDVDTIIADRRYGWIHGLVKESMRKTGSDRMMLSDRIDQVVTHRWLGIPIFMVVMWILFKFTTDVAAPFQDWVDGLIGGPISNWVTSLLGWVGLGGTWVERLLVDGVVTGVGSVLVFVPVLMVLYMMLGLLEDSGYMARAAFVMDRLMHSLGLHGKSFLPMIIGFGCTVPAFYATRTLENQRDRVLTSLLVPFMSCSARLPVYVLMAAVFFPRDAGVVIFAMYMIGIVVAVLMGMLLKRTILRTSEPAPFVMEMPPYRMPTLKGMWLQTWERTSGFLKKAGTTILIANVVVWLLLAIPVTGQGSFAETPMDQSAFAAAAKTIAPIYAPAGFATWQTSGAIVTGFLAKEVVVSTMGQIYGANAGAGEAEEVEAVPTFLEDIQSTVVSFVNATWDSIRSIPGVLGINLLGAEAEEEPTALMTGVHDGFNASSGGLGALAGLGFMVFVLLYTPCVAAIGTERQEIGSKWTAFSVVGQFALAWVAATLIFQIGRLFVH